MRPSSFTKLLFLFLFFRDVSVQFLLDHLIKIAVRVEGGLNVVQTHLIDAYKVCSKSNGLAASYII